MATFIRKYWLINVFIKQGNLIMSYKRILKLRILMRAIYKAKFLKNRYNQTPRLINRFIRSFIRFFPLMNLPLMNALINRL